MRRTLLLLFLVALTGCQNTVGPLASRKRDQKPDPLYNIEEQKRWANWRYPYWDDNTNLYPSTYSDRPGMFGR